ncbi:MAG TPA: hypothetical protein VML75_17485 [Kofleriaceae bacterium]|nr:hypothetical protein [Kofleriaceae bacterium]
MIRVTVAVVLICVLASAARAQSEPAPEVSEPQPDVSRTRRALAVGAALVPGALLHGSGHRVIGEQRTAGRLLALEAAGLGLLMLGAVPLGVSGAASDVSGPAIASMVAGGTVFLAGILADAYGASGLSARAGRAAPVSRARLELEVGYAYVDDPQFEYGSFTVLHAELLLGPARLTPTAWLALDDDNQRVTIDAAYCVLAGRDDSRLEAVLGITRHLYGTEDFAVTGFEASAAGRLELSRVGPSLRGAFFDLMLGVGVERVGYLDANDWNSQLLGRAAFGVYLGDGGGAASVHYDHRRDDFAGGLALARGGGFIGHFGAAAHYRVLGPWSASLMIERGAANVARLGVSRGFELGPGR